MVEDRRCNGCCRETVERLAHEIIEEEDRAIKIMAVDPKKRTSTQEGKLRKLLASLAEKKTYFDGVRKGIDLSKFC